MTGANVPSKIVSSWSAVVTVGVRAVLQAWPFNCFFVDIFDMTGAVLAVLESFCTPRTWKRWEMLPKMAAGNHLLESHRLLGGEHLLKFVPLGKDSGAFHASKTVGRRFDS